MEELFDDLATGDERAKTEAIRQLGTVKDKAAVSALIVALKDPSERVAIAAAMALGSSGDSQASEALWILIGDPKHSRTRRFSAARALAGLGDVRATGPLIEGLAYAYDDAAASLMGLGPVAVPPLIGALRDTETRDGASKVLIAMGGTGVEGLIELLRSQNETKSARMSAASTLAEIEDPRGDAALSEALKEPDPELTFAAYRYIIRRGKAGAETQLIGALNVYGTLTMAQDCMASGNAALRAAGEDWARKRGYGLATRTSEMDVVQWGGVDAAIKRLGLYHFDGSLTSTTGVAPVESRGVSFVSGKWGSALSVGPRGILRYPLAGNLSFKDGTIEMWISPKSDGTDPVYSKYNHALLMYQTAADDQFLVASSALGGFYAGSVIRRQYKGAWGGNITNWKAGTWHHIVFTYSSHPGRQRFFVDGTMTVESNAAMPEPDPGAGSFTVACDSYGNLSAFSIDELLISAAEKSSTAIRRGASRREPFPDR